LTVSVPFIPACSCPGTEQKYVYVPLASVIVTVLVPFVKVGVDPTVLPAESVIVTLCGVVDAFSKSIVTEPAEAVSDVCSNIRLPFGSACSVSFPLATALGAGLTAAGVVDAVVGVVAVGVVAADAGVVLGVELELEDPQPARASAPARHARDGLSSPVFNAFASNC
jgi:hypothetical protein